MCEFYTCSLEEELSVCILALGEVDAPLDPEEVGDDEFLLASEADGESVVEVGLDGTVLDLAHHEQDGHEVDDDHVQSLLLQLVPVRLLRGPPLLVGLYDRQQLRVAQRLLPLAFLLLGPARPEQVLVELAQGVLVADEAHLPQKDGLVVVLVEEEEFLCALGELGERAHMAVDLLEALHEFLADPFVEPDLLLVADFVLDVDDDGGVDEVVAAVGLLDALDEGVVHEFADGVLPLAVVLEDLGHHLHVQPVRQQTQHLDHFRGRLVLVVDHVQRDLHRRLHHLVHPVPVLVLRPLVELLAHVRLQQHHVQFRQRFVGEQGGGEADGLGVAVQELEEGVLAGLLQVLLQRVEVVQLLLLDLSRHFLEEELLGLGVGESAQLEEHFRAVVDLSADGVARGEEEVQVGATAHQDLDQPFEALPLLRPHNAMAVVQHQQNRLLAEFLHQSVGIFARSLVQPQLRSLKQLQVQYFVDLGHGFTTTQLQVDHSVLEVVPELDVPHEFPGEGALPHAWLPDDRHKSPLLLQQDQNLVEFGGAVDVVLDPAGEVLVVPRAGTEIVEACESCPGGEVLSALVAGVGGDEHELLALVVAVLVLEHQLLLGEVEGLADGGLSVDAGQVEQFHEVQAGLVQDAVVVADADDVSGSGLSEHPPGSLRVAAGHEDQFQWSFLLAQQFGQFLSCHLHGFSHFVLEKQIVFLSLDAVSAEVEDFYSLLDPGVELGDGGWLPTVVDPALALLQQFLDGCLLLEVLEGRDCGAVGLVEKGLAVHEEEGGQVGQGLLPAFLGFAEELREDVAERVLGVRLVEGEQTDVEAVQFETIADAGVDETQRLVHPLLHSLQLQQSPVYQLDRLRVFRVVLPQHRDAFLHRFRRRLSALHLPHPTDHRRRSDRQRNVELGEEALGFERFCLGLLLEEGEDGLVGLLLEAVGEGDFLGLLLLFPALHEFAEEAVLVLGGVAAVVGGQLLQPLHLELLEALQTQLALMPPLLLVLAQRVEVGVDLVELLADDVGVRGGGEEGVVVRVGGEEGVVVRVGVVGVLGRRRGVLVAGLGVVVGAAVEGDLDGLAGGRFELDFATAPQHRHQFLDQQFLVLLHQIQSECPPHQLSLSADNILKKTIPAKTYIFCPNTIRFYSVGSSKLSIMPPSSVFISSSL